MSLKNIFKSNKIVFFTGALIFIVAVHGCGSFKKDPRRPVARVNNKAITLKEYQDALSRLSAPSAPASGENLATLKKELINQLVEEELILQEAAKAGLNVSAQEMAYEIESIRNEYRDEDFTRSLAERYGSMDNWKEEVKKKLLIKKTIGSLVAPKRPPGEAEARAYYESHSREFEAAPEVRSRMIVVSSEEDAQRIRKRLTRWNFADIAKETSLSPEAKEGGDLGVFSRGEMPPAFEDAVFRLKPGEISAVIKTDYGYHIFLMEERREGRTLNFPEVREKIIEKLGSQAADEELSAWIASLKSQSKIEIKEDLL